MVNKRTVLLGFIASSAIFTSTCYAIIVTHDNYPAYGPEFPIGSNTNVSGYNCSSQGFYNVPCRLFGIGRVASKHDDTTPGYIETCSGTPIGPTTVLTAAHCFDGGDSGGLVGQAAYGNTYFVIGGVTGNFYGTPIAHPSYSGGIPDASDIAIIILDQPLPSWVPIHKLVSFSSVPTGAVVTHVGFGRTGNGLTGPNTGVVYSTPNFIRNTIDSVSAGGAIFSEDFDGNGINRMGGDAVRTFTSRPYDYVYSEGTTASGDSGGPVFYNSYVDL